jgi:hypothetical protein
MGRAWSSNRERGALMGRREGNRPLGRRRGDYNIKMDCREIGWSYMDWIELA